MTRACGPVITVDGIFAFCAPRTRDPRSDEVVGRVEWLRGGECYVDVSTGQWECSLYPYPLDRLQYE